MSATKNWIMDTDEKCWDAVADIITACQHVIIESDQSMSCHPGMSSEHVTSCRCSMSS